MVDGLLGSTQNFVYLYKAQAQVIVLLEAQKLESSERNKRLKFTSRVLNFFRGKEEEAKRRNWIISAFPDDELSLLAKKIK